MSPEFESRRQRRELEAQQAAAQVAPQYQVPAVPLYAPAAQSVVTPVSAPAQQAPATAPAPGPVPAPAPAPAAAPLPTRRELRMQEQQAAVSAPLAPAAAPTTPNAYTTASWIQDVTPAVASTQAPVAPLQSPVAAPAPFTVPAQVAVPAQETVPAAAQAPVQTPIPSRRELRDQLRQPTPPAAIPVTPFAQPWSELAVTPMFETSSGFSLDTTTNSIVLPITPDALSGPLVIESGVTLRTGSIELPNLNAGTGSIPLPTAAQIADDALSADSANSFVSDIAPVAARNLLRKNPKLGIAPLKTKGTQGQLFYGLTTAFLMLTVGALLLAAWMYGVIK